MVWSGNSGTRTSIGRIVESGRLEEQYGPVRGQLVVAKGLLVGGSGALVMHGRCRPKSMP
jgi:hypothetical protein